MEWDQIVLDYDSGGNNVLVVNSPNIPEAGKGLIFSRKQPMTEDTGLRCWGEVFIHFYQRINIEDLHLEKHITDRLVRLPFQPFIHIGVELYILGSLCCAATYSNMAGFKGWGDDEKKKNSKFENNCFIWCS